MGMKSSSNKMRALQVIIIALILSGRRPPVFRLRAGHDRRALLDGDGAAQPQEGDHWRHSALRARSYIRLPPHAPRPTTGIPFFCITYGIISAIQIKWQFLNSELNFLCQLQ